MSEGLEIIVIKANLFYMVSISLTLDRVSGKLIFAGKLSGRYY